MVPEGKQRADFKPQETPFNLPPGRGVKSGLKNRFYSRYNENIGS
jgi:hypothetical protein